MKKQASRRSETAATLAAAVGRAQELGIRHIVVASTTGRTAFLLARKLGPGVSAVCVTHHAGFAHPGECELTAAKEKKLRALEIPVLRTTHLMAGLDRAIRLKFGGLGPAEIIANTYRTFGEGTKVCVEIAVMALDAGLVPFDSDVIAIAGTGSGADTAIVVRPAYSRRFFDTWIREIVVKPASPKKE